MTTVVTLTPNPAIDVFTSLEEMAPFHKLRCAPPWRDPGGGGINVARVIKRLGGDVTAIYPAGGVTGELLKRLVGREKVPAIAMPVAEETREDITVLERKTASQFRFVFPGAPLAEGEWQACLDALGQFDPRPAFVVASGSLPAGVPDDFYARAARIAKRLGARMILDTSRQALRSALEEGVYLVKPNLGELQGLVGRTLADEAARADAARELVKAGRAEIIALSLGDQGALLTTSGGQWRAPALEVALQSAVGAGDSFLGAMVWALAQGKPIVEAFRYGVAGGSAALLNPGTELCHADDVRALYPRVIAAPLG